MKPLAAGAAMLRSPRNGNGIFATAPAWAELVRLSFEEHNASVAEREDGGELEDGGERERRLIDIARPWLRFLGWWRVPAVAFRFQHQLDQYVVWMRERGFSPLTIEQWQAHARMFLQWCEQTGRHLSALKPGDIDHYFVSEGTGRWSRVSVCGIASGLRAFLRFGCVTGGVRSRAGKCHTGSATLSAGSAALCPRLE